MSENGEMSVEQAVGILRQVTPMLAVPLETHGAIQRAIQTLETAAAKPAAKPAKGT